jgi:putative membrane protein
VNASFGLFALLLAQPAEALGAGPWGFFPFFPLLWLAGLGLAAWVVARGVRSREDAGLARAREILAERYARGELSSDEYRERLEQLWAAR